MNFNGAFMRRFFSSEAEIFWDVFGTRFPNAYPKKKHRKMASERNLIFFWDTWDATLYKYVMKKYFHTQK